jgi:hypothetical protein
MPVAWQQWVTKGSGMTSYGLIRRGPMAAEVLQREFTQIYNKALRDTRTSFKAKGLLAMLLTHRAGFGMTLESIASFGSDGISSVRSGIKELVDLGYLRRETRRSDGSDGRQKGSIIASDYWVTDIPDGLAFTVDVEDEFLNLRSEPSCENRTEAGSQENRRSEPSCEKPPEAKPLDARDPHKKTNSSEHQLEESLSARAEVVPEAHESPEREREATTPDKPNPQPDGRQDAATTVVSAWADAAGKSDNQWAQRALYREVTQLLAAGATVDYLTRAAVDMGANHPTFRSLTRHLEHYTPPSDKPTPEKCPKHPRLYRAGCHKCALEIPE